MFHRGDEMTKMDCAFVSSRCLCSIFVCENDTVECVCRKNDPYITLSLDASFGSLLLFLWTVGFIVPFDIDEGSAPSLYAKCCTNPSFISSKNVEFVNGLFMDLLVEVLQYVYTFSPPQVKYQKQQRTQSHAAFPVPFTHQPQLRRLETGESNV